MNSFLDELFRDLAKQALAFVFWTTIGSVGHAVYSIGQNYEETREASSKITKHCKYENWWEYHPARILTCKIMEML